MSNIVRQEPFDVAFPEFFRSLMRPMRFDVEPALEIRIDLKENDQSYTVRADIPGVRKEDIDVTIDGNVVSIRAEVKREKEETGEKMLRSERYYGSVSRSFTLASDVDEKTAIAMYADGVLELTLPKKAGTVSRRLQVK